MWLRMAISSCSVSTYKKALRMSNGAAAPEIRSNARIAQGGFISPEQVKWHGGHAKGGAFCGVYVVKDGDIILFRFNV